MLTEEEKALLIKITGDEREKGEILYNAIRTAAAAVDKGKWNLAIGFLAKRYATNFYDSDEY